MKELLSIPNLIGAAISSIFYLYAEYYLFHKDVDFKDIKLYITFLASMIVIIANFFLSAPAIKIIVVVCVFCLSAMFIFRVHLKQALVVSVSVQLIVMISELLFSTIFILLFNNNTEIIVNSYFGKIGINFSIIMVCFVLTKIGLLEKIYIIICKISNNIKNSVFIIIFLIAIVSVNFLFVTSYYKINLMYVILFNVVMAVIYLIIIFNTLSVRSKYLEINDKYNNILNSLKEYEDIMDKYRISNHENKNQLLLIRNMIFKKEKKIPEYIDKIIDNKIKDDEQLMFETNIIPAGGLRAVIYSKMLTMKDKKIKTFLKVDRDVRSIELTDLGDQLVLDVCKIIGVFLDNAIEANESVNDPEINIYIYIDDDLLNIAISNTYSGVIDVDRIVENGYTTKNSGHGYGLSLVRDILDKNTRLTNIRKLNGACFTQVLKINYK